MCNREEKSVGKRLEKWKNLEVTGFGRGANIFSEQNSNAQNLEMEKLLGIKLEL